MGNCLGLCEIFRSPDRSSLIARKPCMTGSVARNSARDQNHKNRHSRGSLPIAGPINVLHQATDDVKLHYDLGEELGRGQFGVIRFCIKKHTGEKFACKSIAKGRLCRQKDIDNIRGEIQIMKQLVGHPNIVQLKDVYEDETWVHIVMELCEGGDLFDSIFYKKRYSEKEAASIFKPLMEALVCCNNHGVIHRDLKPENIFLVDKSDPTTAKLADFGLAAKFLPGEKLCGIAGSAYYIAPEVLKGEYGKEVDVWSAGVVLYILLSGAPPFWGDTEEAIFESIKFGYLDLSSDPWPNISAAAKDLIKGILCQQIKKRMTPDQVLSHRWIMEHTKATDLPITPASLPVRIDSSRSWRTETTLSASSYTESEMKDHPQASIASPGDDNVQRVSSFRANSIQRLSTGCIAPASLPEILRCNAEEGEVNQAMLQHCSLPEISKINSLGLGSCIIHSSNVQTKSNNHLTTINSSLEDLGFPTLEFSAVMLQKNFASTLLKKNAPQRTIVVNTYHAKQPAIQIGWKRLEEKEASTTAVSDCSKNLLLWSPDTYAGHAHTQQQQLVC